jgi:perosamine synthetase
MTSFIPIYQPDLSGNESKYVNECLESTWISSLGKYVDEFEEAFADYCGVNHGVSCANGTVALHLVLEAYGIGGGDEVIVPTLTFVATANAVHYTGAKPVFVDSEQDTWNIDPAKIEERITSQTKAIIVVHLYGHPANMDPILEVARRHNLIVIEDAAEAHGAEYKGNKVGSLGDAAAFSFYGNKIITTGEGGMVVTKDEGLTERMRFLKDHGMSREKRYWHPEVGFNYRMTNIQAAIGLAQLERVERTINSKREIAERYRRELSDNELLTLSPEASWAKSVYWLFSVVLSSCLEVNRDDIIRKLRGKGVDSRPFFFPMHQLPIYSDKENSYPIADELSSLGLNLPSWTNISNEDIQRVCLSLKSSIYRG